MKTTKLNEIQLISSGAPRESIRVKRTGIAKVLWRSLNIDVPESQVLAGGVDINANVNNSYAKK